jgi:hypothetical protein
MLPETEIRERAEYCCCVFLQLSWLFSNDLVDPPRYIEYLNKSSLGLGSDKFVVMTIEEGLMGNRPDGGILSLISFYEGLAHAFCQVLETSLDKVTAEIPPHFLQQLAGEMGVQFPPDRSAGVPFKA